MAAKPKFKQESTAAALLLQYHSIVILQNLPMAILYFCPHQVATNSIFHILRENFIVLIRRIKPHCVRKHLVR